MNYHLCVGWHPEDGSQYYLFDEKSDCLLVSETLQEAVIRYIESDKGKQRVNLMLFPPMEKIGLAELEPLSEYDESIVSCLLNPVIINERLHKQLLLGIKKSKREKE